MKTPERIQLKRSKGWRLPEGVVVVARGPGRRWGNPYTLGWAESQIARGRNPHNQTPAQYAVNAYRVWLEDQLRAGRLDLEELRGKDLACWCKPGETCHADLLIELANDTRE